MRNLDFKSGTYPELLDAISKALGFINKEDLATRIDVAAKTLYNIASGEPIGLSTKRRLNTFLQKEFGVSLTDSGNTVTVNDAVNSHIAGGDMSLGDTNNMEFLLNRIVNLEIENRQLKQKLKAFKDDKHGVSS